MDRSFSRKDVFRSLVALGIGGFLLRPPEEAVAKGCKKNSQCPEGQYCKRRRKKKKGKCVTDRTCRPDCTGKCGGAQNGCGGRCPQVCAEGMLCFACMPGKGHAQHCPECKECKPLLDKVCEADGGRFQCGSVFDGCREHYCGECPNGVPCGHNMCAPQD